MYPGKEALTISGVLQPNKKQILIAYTGHKEFEKYAIGFSEDSGWWQPAVQVGEFTKLKHSFLYDVPKEYRTSD